MDGEQKMENEPKGETERHQHRQVPFIKKNGYTMSILM